ncbi:TonB-dependent receptor [Arsukibacterium sp. MJ3]|uniref:TonB-dependent receptor domain-containing protein n=1 Tax=Arsukibacterium sp. MJ3 TaxID=1632859 RepID=UPI0006272719|nr:TonB-dependent receptor [Arsukibacterium sp. MJ3]KKO49150.1 TonB-dependent receptor [Arsukibacterium sp. MJ3]
MKNIAPLSRIKPLAIAISCVLASSMFSLQAQEQNNETEKVEVKTERIQVVGSRIRTDGLDQAAPIEVISASLAASQGISNLGELLRNSTVAAGSNQITAAASTAFVTEGGTGSENISLRGLGANRTLILLNGRRAGPAGTRGQVSSFDPNVLPLSAIDRIEILKDGASSLYGSDAVAGVINIITKKGDEGSINFNTSQPTESGGENFQLNGTYGKTFGRGSFRVVGDYKKQKELAQGQRSFFNCAERYIFDPATGERADPIDPRTGSYHCNDLLWGHVWLYDYQGEGGNVPAGAKAQFDYDGNLGNYIPGFATDPTNPDFMTTPPGWFPVAYNRTSDAVANADHPFQDLETLTPETELLTAYAQGDYELSDSVMLYGEALLNRRTTKTNGYRQFWSYKYNEDFFAGDPLSAGWTGAQWLSPTPITDHSGDKITVDYRRFVLGLNGDFGNWFWDVSYQDSHSDGEYQSKLIYEDAISPYNFESGSCVGEVTAIRGVPCIDVPWLDPQFLAGNITGDVRDFLFGQQTGNTVYKQQSLEGYMTGDLFELPAGPVGVAVGASYQRDSIKDTPGPETLRANTWGQTSAGITEGKHNTKAVFAEFQIPALRDLPLIEALDFTLSRRYTDVSSYGSDRTFKAGVNWQIGQGFRVRASRGSSFRSPALYELYLNNQTSFAAQRAIDPCINWGDGLAAGTTREIVANNCAAEGIPADFGGGAITATVTTGGGAGQLSAETSVAKTMGLVWIPEFTEFTASLDYFDIQITGEVTNLSAAQIVGNCYLSENFSTEPLCVQFDRDPTDLRISDVRGGYLNIATQINRGFDLTLGYRIDTPVGQLSTTYQHTRQLEASQQLFATSESVDRTGEFGRPKDVGNLMVALDYEDWTFNWTARYIGSVSNYTRYGQGEYRDTATYRGDEVKLVLHSDAVIYHAFSVTKDFRDAGVDVTFGVANAFDKEPPKVSSIGGVTRMGTSAFYSQYDWLGRRMFLNVSYQF